MQTVKDHDLLDSMRAPIMSFQQFYIDVFLVECCIEDALEECKRLLIAKFKVSCTKDVNKVIGPLL